MIDDISSLHFPGSTMLSALIDWDSWRWVCTMRTLVLSSSFGYGISLAHYHLWIWFTMQPIAANGTSQTSSTVSRWRYPPIGCWHSYRRCGHLALGLLPPHYASAQSGNLVVFVPPRAAAFRLAGFFDAPHAHPLHTHTHGWAVAVLRSYTAMLTLHWISGAHSHGVHRRLVREIGSCTRVGSSSPFHRFWLAHNFELAPSSPSLF